MSLKSISKKGIHYLTDRDYRFIVNSNLGLLNWMSDEDFLKRKYKAYTGKELDLVNPKLFNEKLQWLKLYYRKPEFTAMVDKYTAKDLVAAQIGVEYIIPTLGVWDSYDEINFDLLPQQFVLKCTHDCGSVIICKDKNEFDKSTTKKKLTKSLKKNFFWYGREWPYKNVVPRIMAETYMEEGSSGGLTDYKVMCFGGEPKFIQVHQNRFNGEHRMAFYDLAWNKLELTQGFPLSNHVLERPAGLDLMLELSKVLSRQLPVVRVDWYYIKGRLYFGELTFFDGSGFDVFDQEDWDLRLGEYIVLPTKTDIRK